MNRAPNRTSKLKNLPLELQQEIYDFSEGTIHTKGHTRQATVEWFLKNKEIKTNTNSLREFIRWFQEKRIKGAVKVGQIIEEIVRETSGMNLSNEDVTKLGQAMFEKLAYEERNQENFVSMRVLRQKDRALDLQEKNIDSQAAHREETLKCNERKVELSEEKWKSVRREKASEKALAKKADEARVHEESTRGERIKALRFAAFAEIDELQASGRVVMPK